MNIYITGMNGQLGLDVYEEAKSRGHNVIGCGRQNIAGLAGYVATDLSGCKNVHTCMVDNDLDAIIHCAAWTNVDAAEKLENKNDVFYANVVATQEAVLAAEKSNAKFIYISTDYVFNNTTSNAIDWCHKAEPMNYYGFTKWLGEEMVKKYAKSYVVRTSWVYGEHGNNFVKTVQRLIEKGEPFEVVNDQHGRPTNTKDLARLLVDMVERETYGVYHATNEGDYISWFQFAQEIAGDKKNLVIPCTTEEYKKKHPNSVPRPKYSMLSTNNLTSNGFSKLPDWKESLKTFMKTINS